MPVAVLLVNYRTYEALDRCLTSLMPQVLPDDEVVVVDWVTQAVEREAIARRFPAVRWLARDDNRGFSAGVNLAARETSAPILLLLNPDSELHGPVVRDLEAHLQRHPQCGVAGPRVLNADGTVQPSARRFPGVSTVLGGRSTWLTRRFPNNWFSRRNLLTAEHPAPSSRLRQGYGGQAQQSFLTADWLAGSCFATPRAVFEQLGGLDETFFMYWEDADYCRRAAALGLRCDYVTDTALTHTGGVSSAHNVVPSIRAFHRSAFYLYWKHSGAGRIAAPLVWLGLWIRGELKVALR